ncbi:hypothetical protein FUA48_08685 [Flavobacterium alkalisoli]|uniref:Uncharacterized protein n=1 Tax=Flavobacterium alkalisoli TaxID=2602769 RepID=A0A5B9FY21_9FLAO|nr:hypothetical protein [Flavobacterium alkalisoli]QEE49657.1 hypothetical protein FUA48_08685 [Flavobacterium alkalisoli]
MDAKEFHKYAKWCNDNFVFIYPVPLTAVNSGNYKIEVCNRGKVKKGDGVYRDKPIKDEVSVWDKIRQLYQEIYNRNNPS